VKTAELKEAVGLLGQALRGTTHGTLLFDETEKAHPLGQSKVFVALLACQGKFKVDICT